MACVQSVEAPTCQGTSVVNFWYDNPKISNKGHLVREEWPAPLPEMVTLDREKPGREIGAVTVEDLANVRELPERDLVPNTRYVLEHNPNGCVLYFHVSHL